MSRFTQYLADTRREMAHVSWPTRAQTISFTVLVVAISIFVALYLSVFDVVFARGLEIAFEHAPRFMSAQSQTAATTSPIQLNFGSTTDAGNGVQVTPIPLNQ